MKSFRDLVYGVFSVQVIAVPSHGSLFDIVGTFTGSIFDEIIDQFGYIHYPSTRFLPGKTNQTTNDTAEPVTDSTTETETIIYPYGYLTDILTGITNQTTTQLNVTLNGILTTITYVQADFGGALITLEIIITKHPTPVNVFANITSTLAQVSAAYTQNATEVTQNSTSSTAGLDFIIQIVNFAFGTVNSTINQITPIIGTNDVQTNLTALEEADIQLTNAGFILFNSPLKVPPYYYHHERHDEHQDDHKDVESDDHKEDHKDDHKDDQKDDHKDDHKDDNRDDNDHREDHHDELHRRRQNLHIEYHRYEEEYHHHQILVANFTIALAGFFNATLNMVKSVQVVAASVAAKDTASNDLVEAVNALVVILATTLQIVLVGLNKTAEIITILPHASFLILTVATNGVNGALQNMTSLVNQSSTAISNSDNATAALTGSAPIIEAILTDIDTYLSKHLNVITKALASLNLHI